MKILAFLYLLIFSTLVYAGDEHFYTGIQLGESKIDSTAASLNVQSVPLQSDPDIEVHGLSQVGVDNDGFAGRAYAGLEFSPYISIEGGYTQYADVKIKNIYGITGKDEQLNEGAIDTVLKLSLPIANHISIYGKGGMAFVMTNQVDDAYMPTGTGSSGTVIYDKESIDRFRPTYGFGINYDITRFMSANFSAARVSGGNGVPTSNLLSLGVAFHLPVCKV